MQTIEAIVFDKDGTLFDLQSTWAPPFQAVLDEIEPSLRAEAANALGFDLVESHFLPESIAIAGTVEEVAEGLLPYFGNDLASTVARLNEMGAMAQQHPAVDLWPCLSGLAARRHLGLVTNDSESPARQHLRKEGILDLFVFVAGYDSGYGAKPGPGQLLAFADVTGIDPAATLMVGDSRHDLEAGRAAGMGTVGVLTGVATEHDLTDLADVVLPDIGHLDAWLTQVHR